MQDIPISGDWDGNGSDGVGVYRPSPELERNEFWFYNNINDTNSSVVSTVFANPMVELNPTKYVYGIYTSDEPMVHNPPVTSSKLQSIYNAYSNLSSHVFFHCGSGLLPVSDPRYSEWSNLSKIGEAIEHFDYPITSNSTASVGHIASTVSQTRALTNESLPNWFALQAYTEVGSYKPSTDQLKAMVYTAVVHGATGIFNFAYNNPTDAPQITGISPTSLSDLWSKSVSVNWELDSLKQYILSKTPILSNDNSFRVLVREQPNIPGEYLPIRTLLKQNQYGDYIIMAVNMTSQSLNAVITLPYMLAPKNRKVWTMFEGVKLTYAGSINDSFIPFGVHIYKIGKSLLPINSTTGRSRSQDVGEVQEIAINQTSILVYPNPSTGSFTFHITDIKARRITIADPTGKIIFNRDFSNSEDSTFIKIELGTDRVLVNAGLYYYRLISSDNKNYSGKLLLK